LACNIKQKLEVNDYSLQAICTATVPIVNAFMEHTVHV